MATACARPGALRHSESIKTSHRTPRLVAIAALAFFAALLPQGLQAQSVGETDDFSVGEMDGFWRRATMTETWLKDGGGLITIPAYVQDYNSSFPYTKRPFPKEYAHADTIILVRVLGGWHADTRGKGEAAAYSDIKQADVVTWNGTGLQFDKAKFIDRIRPFVNAGYEDLVIVLDNIPWSLSGDYSEVGTFGNNGRARFPSHMYWVGRNLTQYLVEEFGSVVASKMSFRYGTETEAAERYNGTALDYFKEYDNVSRGIRYNLPNAKIGPGNFWKLIDANQGAKLKEFLRYIETKGSPEVTVDFLAASRYLKTTTRSPGVNVSPAAAVSETMVYFDSLNDLYGSTVLKNADWRIDEFGFVLGSEPGAFGGALLFNMICGYLQRGIDQMQHWKPYDTLGANLLWTSEGSIYSVFDHLRGGQAYVRSITPLLGDDAEGMSLVVKKDQYTYVMMAAANISRSTQPTKTFTYTFPVSEATFPNGAGVKIDYLSLDRETLPHEIARNHLAAAGKLVSPYSEDPNRVANVLTMGGTAGRDYINQNFSTYTQAYVNAMTLKNYDGFLTKNGTEFRLRVQNMKTPSIVVFRMSPVLPPSNLAASAVSATEVNLTWTDNSNNETGFRIQRSILTGGKWGAWGHEITVPADTTSYAVNGLTANTAYAFRVRANGSSGNNSAHTRATATTP
jgi:hypothetical protein